MTTEDVRDPARKLLSTLAEHGLLDAVPVDRQAFLVPLAGCLLTAEGMDLISVGLGCRPRVLPEPLALARTAGEIARIGLGMRTLLVVSLGAPHRGLSADAGSEIVAHTVLDGWNLVRTHGAGLDLRQADLRGAALAGSLLMGVDLRGADLRGADLSRAVLSGARLEDADLRGADLGRSNLIDVRASAADLRRASLAHADLKRGDFRRAAFGGAELWAAFAEGVCLDGAYTDGADIAQLIGRGTAGHRNPQEGVTP